MIQPVAHTLPHGITLACRQAGSGPVRVVLLHGFPEAAFIWDGVMQALAPAIGCLAPNLRGYAGSSAPTGVDDYRPRALVADVAALLAALGAPIDLLVAHDWGGALAWNLAAQRPDLLRRLLIINAPHPAAFLRELRDNPAQQGASGYMNSLCRPDAAERLSESDYARLWRFFGSASWLTPARRDQYRQAWRGGLDGPLNYYRASPLRPPARRAEPETDASLTPLQHLHLPDDAVTVRVPTSVLWGDQDQALLPGLLHDLQRWVPRLTLLRVPDASHWLVHEQPGRVVAAVQAALAAPVRA